MRCFGPTGRRGWGEAMANAGMETVAERAAAALLGVNGVTVKLRVATLAATNDNSEQLGLATPGFEDLALGRGAFRRVDNSRVLLLGARAVAEALGANGAANAEAMFAGAAGVVVGEVLYRIEACQAMWAGDGVYAYALTLLPPTQ